MHARRRSEEQADEILGMKPDNAEKASGRSFTIAQYLRDTTPKAGSAVRS